MKSVIVFHSVCGNNLRLADFFRHGLEKVGYEARMLRVGDDDFSVWQERFPAVREFAAELNALPVAVAEDLLEADVVVLGSPTYYGNVSSEMKIFLDSTGRYYREQPLLGKRLMCFASSSSNGGGGGFTLDALWRFGQHMGMVGVPVPLTLQMMSPEMSAYGVNHISGALGDVRPAAELGKAIGAWAEMLRK